LQKRIEELESQVKEIKSYIWKPNNQAAEPKKPGPPMNHRPNNRPVPKQIHRIVRLSLDECPDCGGVLSAPVRTRKRYVEDIRPPEPMNTEYHVPYYWCTHCGKQVSPKPAGVVPRCRFGMRLMLLVTFLRYGMLLPLNKIAKELEVVYGIGISEGCLVDSMTRFRECLGPEFAGIREDVKRLALSHMDWTGWRKGGKTVWLWDFIGEKVSLLLIREGRGKGVIYEALGEDYAGISVSDCMPTARYLPWRQQKCWVHFLRYTRNLDSEQGKLLHARLKNIYETAKSGKSSAEDLLGMTDGLKAIGLTEKRCLSMLKRLDKYRDSLFTFIERPGVPDNNNAAERGLRRSVVMRKITGGNRSDKGARNHEVIMSVMQTWEKQGLDFFDKGMGVIQQNLR
jgi:transposase